MSNGIARKIIVLAALLVLGGCASSPVETPAYTGGKPILSAADAEAMIRVTVTTVQPEAIESLQSDNQVATVSFNR